MIIWQRFRFRFQLFQKIKEWLWNTFDNTWLVEIQPVSSALITFRGKWYRIPKCQCAGNGDVSKLNKSSFEIGNQTNPIICTQIGLFLYFNNDLCSYQLIQSEKTEILSDRVLKQGSLTSSLAHFFTVQCFVILFFIPLHPLFTVQCFVILIFVPVYPLYQSYS